MPYLHLADFTLLPFAAIAAEPDLCESYAALLNSLTRNTIQPIYCNGRLDMAATAAAGTGEHYGRNFGDGAHVLIGPGRVAFGRTVLSTRLVNGVESASGIHPAWRGRGYGSVLLARTVELAGHQGYIRLDVVIEEENTASWRQFDKLATAGLARRAYEAETESRDGYYRCYQVPTSHAVTDLHAALLAPAPAHGPATAQRAGVCQPQ